MLGTQISLFGVSKNKNIKKHIEQAFDLVSKYDLKFSYYNPESELYQINNSDSIVFNIDDEFTEILLLAERIYYESNHLYDVTIGNIFDIWDFENEIIPDSLTIQSLLSQVGFDKLILQEGYLFKPKNIKINLNSICKGYIADRVVDFLINAGVKEAIVNCGGDIRFYSNNKKKWTVGIQNPRDRDTMIATLRIPDMAVVTSGDYERFFIIDENRYHHIINPLTGYPTNKIISATILSNFAFIADALSTAIMLMHPFEAIELIKTYPNTDGIIFFHDENEEIVSLKTENLNKWIK